MLPPSHHRSTTPAPFPVGNLIVSSNSRDDKELLDLADYRLREELAGIEGLASAPVFGGVFRQVQIYVHPRALEALKLSPMDVARIVNTQSQVIPTGEIRIGDADLLRQLQQHGRRRPRTSRRSRSTTTAARSSISATWPRSWTARAGGRTRCTWTAGARSTCRCCARPGPAPSRVVDNVKAFLPELHERGTMPEDVQGRGGLRPVAVRPRCPGQPAPRGHPRRGAGLAGRAAVPGQPAQHLDRGPVDPAVDAGRLPGPVLHRPHAQHHDPGRPGPDPGPGRRRLHRGRGEHGPPPEHGQDARWRRPGTAPTRSPCRC